MGTPCTTNATVWSYNPVAGTTYTAAGLNEMNAKIQAEQTRRGLPVSTLTTKVAGTLATAAQLIELKNAIDTCTAQVWSNIYASGQIAKATHVTELHTKLNTVEVICPCDCNYCTCNCNYCTCNCNYCTCNCNYACTCNCNYSDERLKTNIVYF